MSLVEVVTSFLEELASLSCFVLTGLVQWNIDPSAELARLVPYGLAVSDEHYLVGSLFLYEGVGRSLSKIPESWGGDS